MNKLKGMILGFKHHMESIEKEKTRQFEKTMRKERRELEKQGHEQELELKNTEMKLTYKEELEVERLQVQKLRLQNEKELKCIEIEINAKESNQQNSGQCATHKSNVKHPTLELMKFDGDLLKWQEFWDSFDTTVNRNPSLEDIDKLNYLRTQLRGEAKDVIAGLEVTSTSYIVAVDLLKERYSNKQLMIDAHSSKLRDISIASIYYEKIRSTFDQIECHIQSLETLGQNVESEFMVLLLRSKLPRTILAKLEEYKNSNVIWTVANLRKELKKYLSTQELGDRFTKLNRKKNEFKLAT